MMLDSWQNAIIAAIVGPLIVFLLTFVGWALRRLYFKHDEEIKNMALEQKEFDRRLLDVLLTQKGFDEKLRAGFKEMGSNMDNMKSTFKESFDRIGSDMDGMKASISGLETELRQHSAKMDKEIALLRERIGDNGAG